ncbi:MAG: sortase [Clostridiales Family XIII bacterium]|jgi:sortase A|nr:sortase [Clostridiales Family XIII bacterium]
MKKPITLLSALALCAAFAAPVFAADHTFGSGPDYDSVFGKPTGYDEPVTGDPQASNERRNKDAAHNPPPYFYGSGDIPTDPSSPYHDNTPNGAGGGSSGVTELPAAPGLLPSASAGVTQNTAPKYYADGSIGTLCVTKTKKTIKVYEGEDLSNLAKGAGHFVSTSAWDGNAAFAGHNRGGSAHFSFVKDLEVGDTVTYTTPYGARTYAVYGKVKIGEYDSSGLGWSADNILSLITCVENTPEQRFLVQAREVV